MAGALTIEELWARHACEVPHARHVAALAVGLFDRTAPALGVRAAERRLLEAAAWLHDLSAYDGAAGHGRRAAALLRRRGLRGFTRAETASVATAIRLHGGRAPRNLRRIEERGLRLAAFLRVADGLDHGHIQDASLLSVRVVGGAITVRVRQAAYAGNLPWAGAKADLWERLFPLPLHVLAAVPGPADPFAALLPPGTVRAEGVRRLLGLLYREMMDQVEGTRLGKDPEPLHDLRVALRRFRSLLRMARPLLRETSAGELEMRLGALSDALGPLRDSQSWLAFLEREAVTLRADAGWDRYCRGQAVRARGRLARARRLLDGPAFADCREGMRRLVRHELPPLCGEKRLFAPWAVRPAGTLRRRRGAAGAEDPAAREAGALHRLRKDCRRLRYWCEFAAPGGRPRVEAARQRARACADAMGDVHDLDVHLAALGRAQRKALPCLVRDLERRRLKAAEASKRAWRRLCHTGALDGGRQREDQT